MKLTRTLAILAATVLSPLAHANPVNLVGNGGFEGGTFSDWTVTTAASNTGLRNFSSSQAIVHSGDWTAGFGAWGTDTDLIQQTLATVAGTSYTISFWVAVQTSTPSPGNKLEFNWYDGDIFSAPDAVDLSLSNLSDQNYVQYTLTRTATSSSTTISFAGLDELNYILLDDVVVTGSAATVPEPASLALVGLALAAGGVARRSAARPRR